VELLLSLEVVREEELKEEEGVFFCSCQTVKYTIYQLKSLEN
jgi:hypothetical protein